MARLLSFLLILLFTSSATATTYYLDADGGDDQEDGLTPGTAWKTLQRIRNYGPAPGDVFLFKRGCVWSGNQFYITHSGAPGNPITYGAYGDAQDDLPIITNLVPIADASVSANWTQTAANTWELTLAEPPGRLFADGAELLRSYTLAELGQIDNAGAIGEWFYDTTAVLLQMVAPQNPAMLYSSISGNELFYSALVEGAEYVNFSNIDFQGGSGASLAVVGGQHVSIQNCELGRNASTGLLLRNSASRASNEVIVEDNVFDSGFTFYYGEGSARGCGDGLLLRDGATNCEIVGNTFVNWAHNAIEFFGYSSSAAGVNNNRVYDNLISAPDIPYAHPIGVDGLAGKCQQNEIYQNWARDCRTAAQLNGNDNWYHHNIFQRMRRSPSKEQATAHGIILGVYRAGLVCENNRYDHNLIVDTDESAFLVRGYGFSNKVQHNIIRNNIAYNTGKSPYDADYDVGTSLVIYDTTTDGLGPNTYQNNLFYSSNPLAMAVYQQDTDSYESAEQFNQTDGVAGNTVENNVDFEPRFADGSNNFSPADDSPLINAGIDTGLSEDFVGNPRLVGVAPDIGPYESSLAVALPVRWLSLTLDCGGGKGRLQWQVQEENNAYFTVERSTDAVNWKEIGTLPSKATNSEQQAYGFTDHNQGLGLIYYRIQQTDWDGRYSYSDIVSCQGLGKQDLAQLVPQSSKRFRLVLPPGIQTDDLQLILCNSIGQQLVVPRLQQELDLSTLPAGTYFLQVQWTNYQQTIPVVLP